MTANEILKSDILDILFENKNKEYGAYQIRKSYRSRIITSILLMVVVVVLFVWTQSWNFALKNTTKIHPLIDGLKLISCALQPEKTLVKPPAQKKTVVQPSASESVLSSTILIDNKNLVTTMSSADKLDSSVRGNTESNGTKATGIGISKSPNDSGSSHSKITTDLTKNADDEPITDPSVMPQFPGGEEALKNFMLRHLAQPDDLEDGQKVVSIAKFVIDTKGNISNVEIKSSGRDDLDKEVSRVIKMMPRWKPGNQYGQPVSVYFQLPVTFTNGN